MRPKETDTPTTPVSGVAITASSADSPFFGFRERTFSRGPAFRTLRPETPRATFTTSGGSGPRRSSGRGHHGTVYCLEAAASAAPIMRGVPSTPRPPTP